MLDPVGSTSWHNRHLAYFERLDGLLRRDGPPDPHVIVVGPGGVTRLAGPLLNDASRNPSLVRKLIGDVARYGDQLLRRIPGMPLRSLEPLELERVLTVPHRLSVVDRSRRVLAAVSRDLPNASCHCLDIGRVALPAPADVVIAFNVICRLDDPEAGMRHVAEAVRGAGWLLIDDRSAGKYLSASLGFQAVAPKTHRRRDGGDDPTPPPPSGRAGL